MVQVQLSPYFGAFSFIVVFLCLKPANMTKKTKIIIIASSVIVGAGIGLFIYKRYEANYIKKHAEMLYEQGISY